MTLEEVRGWLDSQTWVWAKSYAKTAPHWYVVRNKCVDTERFLEVAEFISLHGQEERFWRAKYTYLYYGDFKYWAMGTTHADSSVAVVINRARVN